MNLRSSSSKVKSRQGTSSWPVVTKCPKPEQRVIRSLPSIRPLHTPGTPVHPIFDIAEVTQLILSHLPPTTLPNCRLVSHQWNSNAVEVMKKKGCVTALVGINGPRGLLQYVDQVNASLPPEPKLNLSISLGVEKLINTPAQISQGLSAMVNLTTILGGTCIHSFTFTCTTNWKECWNEMLGSLHHIAPGLNRLTIDEIELKLPTKRYGNETSQSQPLISVPAAPPTHFPQLLEFNYHPKWGDAQFLRQIVNASPRLQKLKINCEYCPTRRFDIWGEWNSQVAQVHASVNRFTSDFAYLKELTIPLSEPENYTALQRLNFPVLTKLRLLLKLNRRGREEPSELALATFLAQNVPQLVSMEFVLIALTRFPERLPLLPHLTHFGCFVQISHRPAFANAANLNLAQFANLTSVSLHYGQFLYHISDRRDARNNNGEEEEEENVQITFTQVHKLHLIVDKCWEPDCGCYNAQRSQHNFYQHVHELFPAVQELIVDFMDAQTELLRKHETEIEEVLMHLLGGEIGAGLEQLEIRSYYRDWLAALFKKPSAVRPSLRGLKSLTLPPLPKEYKDSLDSSKTPRKKNENLNLTTLSVQSLMAHVPGLEKLKVHDLFLRPKRAAAGRGRSIDEILGEFQLAYPRLIIELL